MTMHAAIPMARNGDVFERVHAARAESFVSRHNVIGDVQRKLLDDGYCVDEVMLATGAPLMASVPRAHQM
ncbi:MAG: hypothetical protein AAGC86_08750 [Pseudomonadota bacterium]